ncbi:MAG: hypothetical protein ACK4NU_04200 [Brevundimonas sp.]
MVNMLYAQIGAIFVVTICLFAFLKGDNPERAGAAAYIVGWFSSLILQQQSPQYSLYGVFILDVLMLVILCAISWRSRRSWPIWAAALQLLAVTSHVMILTNTKTPIASLYTILNLTGYGVLICIGVGAFWAWQERKAATEFAPR